MSHPLTPPPELVKQWMCAAARAYEGDETWIDLANHAACWGADQELEACVEWLNNTDVDDSQEAAKDLRAARRPKPPSLAEEALAVVENSAICDHLSSEHETILRHALERLRELEQGNE